MNTTAYRWCSIYASLVMLNLMWAVSCVPLVTAPAATTALMEQTGRMLRDDDAVTARTFAASLRRSFCGSAKTFGVLAPVWAAALAAILLARTPIVTGMAFGLLLVLTPLTVLAASCASAVDSAQRAVRRAVAMIVLRPGAAAVIAVVWLAAALLCAIVPSTVALAVWTVGAAAPAAVTVRLLDRNPVSFTV